MPLRPADDRDASHRMHDYLQAQQRKKEDYWMRKYGKLKEAALPSIAHLRNGGGHGAPSPTFANAAPAGLRGGSNTGLNGGGTGSIPRKNGAGIFTDQVVSLPSIVGGARGVPPLFQAKGPIKDFFARNAGNGASDTQQQARDNTNWGAPRQPSSDMQRQGHHLGAASRNGLNEKLPPLPHAPVRAPVQHAGAAAGWVPVSMHSTSPIPEETSAAMLFAEESARMLRAQASEGEEALRYEHSQPSHKHYAFPNGSGSPAAAANPYQNRPMRDLELELAVLKSVKAREDVLDRLRIAADKLSGSFGGGVPLVLSPIDPLVRLFYRSVGMLRQRTLDCIECIAAWQRKVGATEPFIYYGTDYLANIGPDLAFLDALPFLRTRLTFTKAATDPFLSEVTADGIPIEEATTCDLRRGGIRFSPDALRIRMARKVLAAYTGVPMENPSLADVAETPPDARQAAASKGKAAAAGVGTSLSGKLPSPFQVAAEVTEDEEAFTRSSTFRGSSSGLGVQTGAASDMVRPGADELPLSKQDSQSEGHGFDALSDGDEDEEDGGEADQQSKQLDSEADEADVEEPPVDVEDAAACIAAAAERQGSLPLVAEEQVADAPGLSAEETEEEEEDKEEEEKESSMAATASDSAAVPEDDEPHAGDGSVNAAEHALEVQDSMDATPTEDAQQIIDAGAEESGDTVLLDQSELQPQVQAAAAGDEDEDPFALSLPPFDQLNEDQFIDYTLGAMVDSLLQPYLDAFIPGTFTIAAWRAAVGDGPVSGMHACSAMGTSGSLHAAADNVNRGGSFNGANVLQPHNVLSAPEHSAPSHVADSATGSQQHTDSGHADHGSSRCDIATEDAAAGSPRQLHSAPRDSNGHNSSEEEWGSAIAPASAHSGSLHRTSLSPEPAVAPTEEADMEATLQNAEQQQQQQTFVAAEGHCTTGNGIQQGQSFKSNPTTPVPAADQTSRPPSGSMLSPQAPQSARSARSGRSAQHSARSARSMQASSSRGATPREQDMDESDVLAQGSAPDQRGSSAGARVYKVLPTDGQDIDCLVDDLMSEL